MKALLLAAGLGTRLKPITDTVPKCLVPIDGYPLLGYWLKILDIAGVEHFYINLHYHAKTVRDFIATTPYTSRVTFIEEDELLGTGGTLKKNAKIFMDDSFLIAHADNLCLCDFKSFFNAHKNRPENTAITMMTFNSIDPKQCGVVSLNEQNIVTSFHEKVEKPPTNLANGAVFVMEPEVVQYSKTIEKDVFEISLDIIPHFIGRILAWHNSEYHLDIGTLEAYKKVHDEKNIVQELYKKYGGYKK